MRTTVSGRRFGGSRARRTTGTLLLARLVVAQLLVAQLAMSVAAAAGPLSLSGGRVSPSSGVVGTNFTFSVTYVSKDGAAPANVVVRLDGVSIPMRAQNPGDRDYKDGAVFVLTRRPPLGTHRYSFGAVDAKGRSASLAGGTFTVVKAPPPTPAPTPKPTLKPTPKPTPRPTLALTPRPVSATPKPTSVPPTAAPVTPAPATAAPTPTPAVETSAPTATPDGAGAGVVGLGPGGPGAALTGGRVRDPIAWVRQLIGVGTLPAIVGVVLVITFLLAARRRRAADDAAGAPGAGASFMAQAASLAARMPSPRGAAAATTRRGRSAPATELPSLAPPPLSAQEVAEAAMPRWRRPSLMAARTAMVSTSPTAAEPAGGLTFSEGQLAAAGGLELRGIRYHMVPLLDRPDQVAGRQLATLEVGDQVQVIERSGVYIHVRTPLGQAGWIHRTTLGEQVRPTAAADAGAPATRDEVDLDAIFADRYDLGPDAEEPGLAERLIQERLRAGARPAQQRG